MKGLLVGAWTMLHTWQHLQPPSLHPPCPVKLLKALVACACSWEWLEVATVLPTGFYCLLRPAEYLTMRWTVLIYPGEHDGDCVMYVAIPKHKTMRRGPRRSHVKLEEPAVVQFLLRQRHRRQLSMPICACSPATWRRRLRALLSRPGGGENLILPRSLRPGAAMYYFMMWNEDVARLMWRGGWSSSRVLENYVQELIMLKNSSSCQTGFDHTRLDSATIGPNSANFGGRVRPFVGLNWAASPTPWGQPLGTLRRPLEAQN